MRTERASGMTAAMLRNAGAIEEGEWGQGAHTTLWESVVVADTCRDTPLSVAPCRWYPLKSSCVCERERKGERNGK